MHPQTREKYYKEIIGRLPEPKAPVTPERFIRGRTLALMRRSGRQFEGEARFYEVTVERNCHAVSVYAWLKNPTWCIVAGFAYNDPAPHLPSAWHFHSFLIDDHGVIVEPTPIPRRYYWGAVLTPDETLDRVQAELPVIEQLGLVLPPDLILPPRRENEI